MRTMAESSRSFPDGFFTRVDESPDDQFYEMPRFVTHLDDDAIAAVADLYDELRVQGRVLDVCASWVSHFRIAPTHLVVLGLNPTELDRNAQAAERVVQDLNRDPELPFDDASFDAATCCVSIDYLVQPIDVFDQLARVVRPGGRFVCTFSNRCFPTKAIRGWLSTGDEGHVMLVREYFERSDGWDNPVARQCTPVQHRGDPLFAVWAERS